MPRIYIRVPPEERFWRHVKKTQTCWLWTKATNGFGYGMINLGSGGGRTDRAHRLSWRIHNGPIPDGMFVCHSCDTPACVRPEHLFLGTHTDNMRDCISKGRFDRIKRPKGSGHGNSVLTEKVVMRLRRDYASKRLPLQVYAVRYGVHLSTVHNVLARKTWKHVT